MKCPNCGKNQTFVVLSHMDGKTGKIRIRRYRCDVCNQHFYTGEVHLTKYDEKEKDHAEN